MPSPPGLFSHRPYWAKRLLPAPVLPTSRAEMDQLGWDACDVILVTGDAYVDHPSFGAAVIGRLLEAHGFRVGVIAQPAWDSAEPYAALGQPALFFGVTAGNMDSMVNRYTADRLPRRDDAYTPGGEGGKRPDRCTVVYAQRLREAFRNVPIVLGGIEASLRRTAHFDGWSETVRRSILFDARADLLLYGNAERAVVELAHRLAKREPIASIRDLRGTAYACRRLPDDLAVIDASDPDAAVVSLKDREHSALRLPSFARVKEDRRAYAHASRLLHLESNPHNARALVQDHGTAELVINPPPWPLATDELDRVYELPYTRRPHPDYGDAKIPAWEMIRTSVSLMRGCFGGCTFCSITEHEGRIIQSRSTDSVLREIEAIRDTVPGFTGVISDLGGPTANMYRLNCSQPDVQAKCRRLSCVYPDICPTLDTDHAPLVDLYRRARALPGIKKVLIASGVRYDLAVKSPEYVKELATHHVGGYLKIAPEHSEEGPLSKMMKPTLRAYDRFKQLFDRYSKAAGKEQYLIPYFIAAHPGTSDEDMLQLALWLKAHGFRLDQVQTFLPTPMALATAMYHSGFNPLKRLHRPERVATPRKLTQRRLHKAFLRYHDPASWPLLREALKKMGRADLIGNGKRHLVPAWQPGREGRSGPGVNPGKRRPPSPVRRARPGGRRAPR
jgi:uncharacterized radical SAM protein YgiQ